MSWWDGLEWGSIADWFAAVGTVGALFLAVWILWNDRRRARRASADAFATWTQLSGTHAVKDMANFTVTIYGYNAGDRPIFSSFVAPKPGSPQKSGAAALSLQMIKPGQTVSQQLGFEHDPIDTPIWLGFTDGTNQRWIRDLSTNTYVSKNVLKKLRLRYEMDPVHRYSIFFPSGVQRPFPTPTPRPEPEPERPWWSRLGR